MAINNAAKYRSLSEGVPIIPSYSLAIPCSSKLSIFMAFFSRVLLCTTTLNRMGEAFIKPDKHNRLERVVHKVGQAKKMLAFMQNEIRRKQMLDELRLVAQCGIKEQPSGEITMETPVFFQKVREGKIIVKQAEIACVDGKSVTLTNGEKLESDLIVFATGFKQTIPFLPDHFMNKLLDKQGNSLLYHHVLPAGVPALAFVGYNSSIQSTISSQLAAL
jgi:dimethylaniline monooxygenase (N-oxide forming)